MRSTIMSLALRVYDVFKDDDKKAKELANIFDEMENNYMRKEDFATKVDLEKAILILDHKIDSVRNDLSVEIDSVRNDLSVEINSVRTELKTEIISVKKDLDIKTDNLRLYFEKRLNRHTVTIITLLSIMIGSMQALSYLIK